MPDHDDDDCDFPRRLIAAFAKADTSHDYPTIEIELLNDCAILLAFPNGEDGGAPSATLWEGDGELGPQTPESLRRWVESALGHRRHS